MDFLCVTLGIYHLVLFLIICFHNVYRLINDKANDQAHHTFKDRKFFFWKSWTFNSRSSCCQNQSILQDVILLWRLFIARINGGVGIHCIFMLDHFHLCFFFSIPSLLYHVLVGTYVFSIHIITHIIMNGYIVMRYLTKVSFARLIIIGFLPRPFERWVAYIYRVTQIKVWIFYYSFCRAKFEMIWTITMMPIITYLEG